MSKDCLDVADKLNITISLMPPDVTVLQNRSDPGALCGQSYSATHWVGTRHFEASLLAFWWLPCCHVLLVTIFERKAGVLRL